ncbi:lysine exporter (LYSE/YGGA) [Candidatus Thioglobus autotrophicus]|jgi:threonine/homoserine/homoserine lactone efflux protein|uniref:Lysine exporter (LYSE/YGGA) n=1 Tax=Candidatus Thioglobus autotrophicus TaxID=1705394 RepID=A0A0M3TUA5_9GAMM|nr:LysE family translocator [Candidatus Thioglobus autotrophicus]ALE52595.1 lysine exporter (LYSE/YGGA) [Candidatus Thioglobus autotrophicus]WPE16625.1 LysE family translocator [Candidatus Thioglobus autotrophicus]WPE18171.1 LysE family translocator [Candidatus Thioglobus autotrophicus]
MELLTLLSLMFATFVYAISPGPGIFAVLATSTRYGPIAALWLSIGHVIGDILYVSIAMFALTFLAQTIEQSMVFVKMFGATYLLYIGFQQYRSMGVSFKEDKSQKSIIHLLFSGFIVGGTNPKTIIYYLSFLPIFIDLNNLTLMTEVQVIVVVGVTVLLVLSLANILGLRLRKSVKDPSVIQKVNKITGITMMLVGVFVALY